MPLSIRSTKTTGCPQCATAFRLCLKEYQQSTVQTQPGVLNGCSFGNVTSGVIGGSSFVLSDLVAKAGSLVLPFTFRWTVSSSHHQFIFHHYWQNEREENTHTNTTHLAFDLFLIANEHIVIDTIAIAFEMKGISIRPANTIILHFTTEYSRKREKEKKK